MIKLKNRRQELPVGSLKELNNMEMQTCEKCGNQYDKAFTVLMDGEQHVFDCFECAISKLAPHCSHCNTLIIGHGVEAEGGRAAQRIPVSFDLVA